MIGYLRILWQKVSALRLTDNPRDFTKRTGLYVII